MHECQQVDNNNYSKHTHNSFTGVKLTIADFTGMQLQQQYSVFDPTGLLMVHAVLTLAVNVWLCGTTHI